MPSYHCADNNVHSSHYQVFTPSGLSMQYAPIGPIHGRAYYGGGGDACIRTTFDVSNNIYSTCKLHCERKEYVN
jgi:hypothetical protein